MLQLLASASLSRLIRRGSRIDRIQLIARTDETVTLRASDYDAQISAVEDAEDIADLLAAGAREDALGKLQARADRLPVARVERLLDGEDPTRIWWEHRGLSPQVLALAAGLSQGDLADIEAGRRDIAPWRRR